MSLSIRTNVASLNAQNNLASAQTSMAKTMGQLSSGERITSAADDAAGLGISTALGAQIRGYQQASRNAQDGISLVQTAEGSMNEISNILSRLRELAMQSASDGVGQSQRDYIHTEADQLMQEVGRITSTTEFNGTKLLNGTGGSSGKFNFQVGIRGTSDDQITVDMSSIKTDCTTLGLNNLVSNLASNSNLSTLQGTISTIDTAIDKISSFRSQLGAAANRFTSVTNTIAAATQSLSAANSRIRDVDVAQASADLAKQNVLMQAGISVLAQANQAPQMALKLLG